MRIDHQIREMNSGGCCVFAESVFPYLEAIGLNPQVRCASWNNVHLDKVRDAVENKFEKDGWNCEGVYFNRVLVEVKINRRLYLVDST